MSSDAEWFIEQWDSREDRTGWVLIWLLRDKSSHWFRTAGEAAKFVTARQSEDVYLGVGYSPQDYGPKVRCKANQVIGIPALWADFDVAGAPHTKPGLPADEGEVLDFLDSLPLKPTAIVHSGHGLQAWWFFREAWIFDGAADRERAVQLARDWHNTLAAKASARGWVIDAVHDLSRVMRVPGTTNNKTAPVATRVLSLDESLRYNPDDFDPYIIAVVAEEASPVVSVGNLVVDPSAQPPFDKHEAARVNDRHYARTWERKRSDLKDQSASGYDMALANAAVRMGWSDQEICNLLIAHNRLHGTPIKTPHYYAKTIGRARTSGRNASVQAAFDDLADSPKQEAPSKAPGTNGHSKEGTDAVKAAVAPAKLDPDKVRDGLAKVLGVRILKIIQYTCEPSLYSLVTPEGSYALGGIATITTYPKFRDAVADLTGRVIPVFKAGEWREVSDRLLSIREQQDVGAEATERGAVELWLAEYTASQTPYPTEERDRAVEQRQPFYNGPNELAFFGDGLRNWLAMHQNVKLTAPQMGRLLRAYGCTPSTVTVGTEGRRTTREVWTLMAPATTQPPVEVHSA